MSSVIPLPPEHFHLGKLVLEESSMLQLSTQGPVSLLFPLDHISFLALALFFRQAGHSTRSTLSSPSKKNNTNLPSVENWCENQRWEGHRGTDLVNRPCMEVVLAGISPNSPFPCGLELPRLSTCAGNLLCLTGCCEPDLEPHATSVWRPQVWIQFGMWSISYEFIHMKTRPSSLLLPCVTAALVGGCASTSLLLHPCEPCLATGNELIQLKFSSLPVNTQK